jgi:serine protease AprX
MGVGVSAPPRLTVDPDTGEPIRYKVRFPDRETLEAARAVETPLLAVPVENEKRRFISVQARPVIARGAEAELPSMDELLEVYETQFGADIVEDRRYDLEQADLETVAEIEDAPSLDDVLELIRAPEAWEASRGADVAIAIVDTGIDGTRPEFPEWKRLDHWAPLGENAWQDWHGHGTMAACIASATRVDGGSFDGVAPDASLISCRTHLFDSELASIYDFLGERAASGEPLIASNSFGVKSAEPPDVLPDDDFPSALADAVENGLLVCFSAGNYHELVGGAGAACEPNSIWTYKCREDVLVVAASRMDEAMWHYSSRGPGQHHGEEGTTLKPDVTAPSPENGRVLYGSGVRSFPDGWGTSGSCPQAAGLLALLLSARSAGRGELFGAIRGSARSLGWAESCEGTGLIDCEGALQQHI